MIIIIQAEMAEGVLTAGNTIETKILAINMHNIAMYASALVFEESWTFDSESIIFPPHNN